MKERPILFSAPMVRAVLAGTKTQTRRIVKGVPLTWLVESQFTPEFVACAENGLCPYGQPGERLWVRETLEVSYQGSAYYTADMAPIADHDALGPLCDRYGHPYFFNELKGVPSIHMPRWASRITLEIVSVRVERLNEISEQDARAEGVETTRRTVSPSQTIKVFKDYLAPGAHHQRDARGSFASLWESINGAGSWAANPWVWVVEFRRLP